MQDDGTLEKIFEKNEKLGEGKEAAQEPLAGSKPRGKAGRNLLIGGALIALVAGTAVTEHYTGIVGKSLDSTGDVTHTIAQGVENAYDGTLSFISNLRTKEGRLDGAKNYLINAPQEDKTKAMQEIYTSLPAEEKESFLKIAVENAGQISETARSDITSRLLEGSSGQALVETTGKSYDLMDGESKEKALDGILKSTPGNEVVTRLWKVYSGMDQEKKAGFTAMVYQQSGEEENDGLLDKALSIVPAQGWAAIERQSYLRLPKDQQFEVTKSQVLGLEPLQMQQIYVDGAEQKFSPNDFELTIGSMYRVSREKYDNGGAIMGRLIKQHAEELGGAIRHYTRDLVK